MGNAFGIPTPTTQPTGSNPWGIVPTQAPAPAKTKTTDYNTLLAKGDYAGAFAAAHKSGQLNDLLSNATNVLQQANPKGMSQKQYEDYYAAFTPYYSSLAGSGIQQGAGTGLSSEEQWNNKPLTPAQIKQAADQQYAYALKSGPNAGMGGSFGQGTAKTAQIPIANIEAATSSGGVGSPFASWRPDKKWFDNNFNKIGLMAMMAYAGPALAGAMGGGMVGGAAAGATTGAAGSALQGGNVAKGALLGGLGGGLAAGATPYVQDATHLGNTASSALTGAGVGAVRGAVSGQGAGMGAASGLISGLAGSTAAKSYAGDLFGNTGGNIALGAGAGAAQGALTGRGAVGGALMGGGGAAAGAGFNYLTGGGQQPSSNTGSPSMTDYNPNDPYSWTTGNNGASDWGSSGSAGNGNGGLGSWTDPSTGQSYDYSGNTLPQGYGNPTGNGGSSSGGQGGAAGGLLSKLFGSGGLGSGPTTGLGLLGGLFGAGLGYAGSNMQNGQARQAAGQYAQNSMFKPYGMSGPGGSASFANGKGQFALSGPNQQLYTDYQNLGKMADSNLMHTGDSYGGYRGMNAGVVGANNAATAAGQNPLFSNVNGAGYNGLLNSTGANATALGNQARGMAGGLTQDAQNADFANQYDMLQNRDRQANNRFMSGNLDSEFANGTLASTAGQYQTQGALDALNTRSTNNALTAQNFATQNMGQRVNAFGAVGGMGNQDANQFQNLGQNQYNQNFANNQTGYNRASDAFGRAMGMFSGGNNAANANAQTYQGLLGGAQSGINGYDNYGNSMLTLGGQFGAEQSGANSRAFLPQVQANGVSTNGDFLSGMGQMFGKNPYSFG